VIRAASPQRVLPYALKPSEQIRTRLLERSLSGCCQSRWRAGDGERYRSVCHIVLRGIAIFCQDEVRATCGKNPGFSGSFF